MTSLSLTAFVVSPPTKAELFDSPVKRLPLAERVALQQGDPLFLEGAAISWLAQKCLLQDLQKHLQK